MPVTGKPDLGAAFESDRDHYQHHRDLEDFLNGVDPDTGEPDVDLSSVVNKSLYGARGSILVADAASDPQTLDVDEGAANYVLAITADGLDISHRDVNALPQVIDAALTESFTVSLAQVGRWVQIQADDANDATITLPAFADVAIPDGVTITFEQLDSIAEWTFAPGAGATIRPIESISGNPRSSGQGSIVFATKMSATQWRVAGQLVITDFLNQISETGVWTDDGADTGDLDGGKLIGSTFIAEQTYTALEYPLPVADGGTLGGYFIAQGQVDLDFVGNAAGLIGPQQATGIFGPYGVFQNSITQVVHENQFLYGHGPVGFQDEMLIKNVAGETRHITPSYSFLSVKMVVADGGAVTVHRTDALDGLTAFMDNTGLFTAGNGTIDADENEGSDPPYTMYGFLSAPGVFGNVDLSRRVAFYARDVTSNPAIPPVLDDQPGVGGRLTNDLDTTAPTILDQYGFYAERMDGATNNYGLRVDSAVRFWSDTATLTANTVGNAIIGSGGTFTFTTSADIPPRFINFASTYVIDLALNAFAVGSVLYNSSTLKSAANSTARDFKTFRMIIDEQTITADTSSDTMSNYASVYSKPTLSRTNSGTLALTDMQQVFADGPAIGAGVTVTTRRGVRIEDATGSGTLTNDYGLQIARVAKGATKNRAIQINRGGFEWAEQESANDGTSALAASAASAYIKSNSLCFAYNDAGTMRYLYIALTGTGTTWTHSTTGP